MRARGITKDGKPIFPEDHEHAIVAHWLDLRNLLWWHTPNGGSRNRIEAAKLRRMGVKPGVPDFIILTPPKKLGASHVALELKALDGEAPTSDQASMLAAMKKYGWETGWFRGADAAIDWLQKLYG